MYNNKQPNKMKTRKQKIDYLVKTTNEHPWNDETFFPKYLGLRLERNLLLHKDLDEMIDYCNRTNGGCLLLELFQKDFRRP